MTEETFYKAHKIWKEIDRIKSIMWKQHEAEGWYDLSVEAQEFVKSEFKAKIAALEAEFAAL